MEATKQTTSDAGALLETARGLFSDRSYNQSEKICYSVLDTDPYSGDALRLLGLIQAQTGRLQMAILTLEKACGIEPRNALYKKTLARMYMASGEFAKATFTITEAIEIDPENTEYKNIFVNLVRAKQVVPSSKIKSALLICLQDSNVMRQYLQLPWISFILHDNEFNVWQQSPTYSDFLKSATSISDVARTLDDPILLAGLPVLHSADFRLEKALTFIRRYCLEICHMPDFVISVDFLAALALHCFQNEYVFAETPNEERKLEKLRASIKNALPDARILALATVYSCYRPLITLNITAEIREKIIQSGSPLLKELAKRQIDDLLREAEIKANIPTLTPIQNYVSVEIGKQYEQNPYPRWLSLPLTMSENEDWNPGKGKSILNAGCGTGQAPISMAMVYPGAELTAIDLSRSSLAYAKRKAEEMGLGNISFAQADILELDAWDKEFDIIMSNGVLHHMDDPVTGWKVLCQKLKPHGAMYISLYSELARQDIIEARQWIKCKNLPTTANGIRAFRQHVLECIYSSDPLNSLLQRQDFFSLSGCRDLVFNIKEHRFSCLNLKAILEELGMRFLGFDGLGPQMQQSYLHMFPDDCSLTNLENWHTLEQQNPRLFWSMYNFWCGRKNEQPEKNLPIWIKKNNA